MRNIQYPCCYQFRNKAIKQQIYLRSHINFFLLSLVINSVRSGQFYSQFYPGEVPAGQEMVEGSVRDERTVVQLQHGQLGPGGGGLAELLDPLVSDQLAVGEREGGEGGAVRGQADQGGVRDEAALVQVQPGEAAAVLGQSLEAGVGEVGEAGTLQGDQLLAVVPQADQGAVRQVGAV